MGGNIKFFSPTRRYDKEEYYNIEKDVIDILYLNVLESNEETIQPSRNIQAIKAYKNKDSFGDMDLIINSKHLKNNYIDIIVDVFNLRVGDWSKNGDVLSFVYEELQIDLIITPEEHFQTSLSYFAYNDCGNLVGRITKKWGIKFGHKGSELIVRNGDQVLGEILITKSVKPLFDLIDLNYDKWYSGFDDLDDIFYWISESKYFNKNIYLLDNRNHYSRTRDAKRKTYHEFLDWCRGKQFYNEYQYGDMTEKDGYNIRQPFFDMICEKFPHVLKEYNNIISKHEKEKLFKEIFNGKIIMEQTGFVAKELGSFMTYSKDILEQSKIKETYHLLDETTRNTIIRSLKAHYENGYDAGEIIVIP